MEAVKQERREAGGTYTELARWLVLVGLMLGTILEVLDVSIVNIAIPDIMGNLGATLDQVNWVSTGYIVANVIVLPLSGWLAAYLGRRTYLVASILLFTAASLLCGLSRSLNALIAFRVLQGAGGAALLSTAMATLLEIFPANRHGLVAAIFGAGVMIAPTVGPTLGGWITDAFSWPWIFYLNIPIGISAALLTRMFMLDNGERTKQRVDGVGIALLAIGVGCLQVVLERGNREDWFESSTIRALSLAAAAGLVLFVWWELRSRAPAVNLRVLRDRGLVAGTVYSVVVGCGIYSSLFFLPVFLQQVRGYTATQTGMMLVVDGIAAAVSMASAGRLVARAPARLLVGIGTLMFAASMYLLYGITADTGPEQIRLALILRGGSLGFTFVPLSIAALTGLKGQDMADGSGLFNLTRQWGGSAGIAFLSTLLEHRSAFHRAILVEHVNLYSPMVAARYRMVQSYLVQRGVSPAVAPQKTAALMERIVEQQAAVMGFADVFLALAAVFMMALPLLFLFSKAGAETVAAPLV